MSESEVTLIVVRIVFAVLSLVITYYVLPFINELTEKYKNEKFENFVSDSVRAAEQIINGSGKGAIKKERVLKEVSKWAKDHNIDISEEVIDVLIESLVYTMNHSKELAK